METCEVPKITTREIDDYIRAAISKPAARRLLAAGNEYRWSEAVNVYMDDLLEWAEIECYDAELVDYRTVEAALFRRTR